MFGYSNIVFHGGNRLETASVDHRWLINWTPVNILRLTVALVGDGSKVDARSHGVLPDKP